MKQMFQTTASKLNHRKLGILGVLMIGALALTACTSPTVSGDPLPEAQLVESQAACVAPCRYTLTMIVPNYIGVFEFGYFQMLNTGIAVGYSASSTLSFNPQTGVQGSLSHPDYYYRATNDQAQILLSTSSGSFIRDNTGYTLVGNQLSGVSISNKVVSGSVSTVRAVGYTRDQHPNGPGRPFLWTLNSNQSGNNATTASLNFLQTPSSNPYGYPDAISNNGNWIVGHVRPNSSSVAGAKAALWKSTSGVAVSVVNSPTVTESKATDVNNDGVVVGNLTTTDNSSQPFVYFNNSTQVLDLPNNCRTGWAYSVNNRGTVVGGMSLTNCGQTENYNNARGFRATRLANGTYITEDLNDLLATPSSVVISYAKDINDRGQILVSGWRRDPANPNNEQLGYYVLTPVQ